MDKASANAATRERLYVRVAMAANPSSEKAGTMRLESGAPVLSPAAAGAWEGADAVAAKHTLVRLFICIGPLFMANLAKQRPHLHSLRRASCIVDRVRKSSCAITPYGELFS